MATPRLLLLAISCSAALAAPGPGADPAYGLIKTIQLFDDDAASADILRNEVFYSQDEDTQLVFPHNYAPEEVEDGGRREAFPAVWLRDCSSSPDTTDPVSLGRTFLLKDLDTDIRIEKVI